MRTAIRGVAGMLAIFGLSACNGQLFGGGSDATTSAFEFSLVAGTASQTDVGLKVNVSSGQAWITNGTQTFTAITDPAAIPAGDYHISSWSTPDGTGRFTWDAYRFDRKTGKAWYANCPTMPTCSWTAVTP